MSRQVIVNPWGALRRHTPARIALGRVGGSLPTQAHLDFQLAHARARDAVLLPLDFTAFSDRLSQQGFASLQLSSAVTDRQQYLQRPDLGRILDEASAERLTRHHAAYDVAFVIVDGLSSLAVDRNAIPMLAAFQPYLEQARWRVAPLCLVNNGRVAVGDPIAHHLGARMVVVLIGERPGLSSPDSLGIYFTYNPHPGMLDSERNCLSNVRDGGMPYSEAAMRLDYLIREACRRQISGVDIKDDTQSTATTVSENFLLP